MGWGRRRFQGATEGRTGRPGQLTAETAHGRGGKTRVLKATPLLALSVAAATVSTAEAAPPDGERIVFSRQVSATSSFDLWIMNTDGSNQRQLTRHGTDELQAAPSPDGRLVAYVRAPAGDYIRANPRGDVWILDLESGEDRPLLESGHAEYKPSWSRDGARIAFSREAEVAPGVHGGADVWTIAPEGGEATALLATADNENYPSWAPDHQSLTFVGTASSVAVRDAEGRTRTVTRGQAPQWSPVDGSKIAYQLAGDGDLDLHLVTLNEPPEVVVLLDTDDAHERFVSWAPDGSELAYARVPKDGGCAVQLALCPSQIYAVSFDGRQAGTPRAVGTVAGAFDNHPAYVPGSLPQGRGKPSDVGAAPTNEEAATNSRSLPISTLPETGGGARGVFAASWLVAAVVLGKLSNASRGRARRRRGPATACCDDAAPLIRTRMR